MAIPFVLVGDGPQDSTGLGRILRDLGRHIRAELDVELLSVGGPPLPLWRVWPHVPMGEAERGDDWGATFVADVYRQVFGTRPGILWVIWDPSRLAPYRALQLPVQLWSYPALDAPSVAGTVSGPAGEAVCRADRVVAYGRWAAGILQATGVSRHVPYLPHGIAWTAPAATPVNTAWVDEQFGPYRRQGDRVIGCVATNQPRKDLALYFATLAELQRRGHQVYGWLHTDHLIRHWNVVQLALDYGLARRVTVTTKPYTDEELLALYCACAITVAPGLGEGFGYPIVESLYAGTPVVHGDFGGGRELIPRREWRFPVRERRVEGIYNQQRPVFRAEDVANAVERVWAWQAQLGPDAAAAYCRGAVAHLEWSNLWPRWRGWIRGGL